MTKDQENLLSTFEPVEGILIANKHIWQAMPGFVSIHDQFFSRLGRNRPRMRRSKITGSGGSTITKSAQRTGLQRITAIVSGNVYTYAAVAGNAALQHDMTFTMSSLERMRDNILLITARLVRNTANANMPALAAYGYTDAQQRELAIAIEAFETGSGAPRKAISTKKTATTGIREKLKTCLGKLELLDRLIENFRADYPDFISDYFNARRVIDLGHRSNPDTPPPTPARMIRQ